MSWGEYMEACFGRPPAAAASAVAQQPTMAAAEAMALAMTVPSSEPAPEPSMLDEVRGSPVTTHLADLATALSAGSSTGGRGGSAADRGSVLAYGPSPGEVSGSSAPWPLSSASFLPAASAASPMPPPATPKQLSYLESLCEPLHLNWPEIRSQVTDIRSASRLIDQIKRFSDMQRLAEHILLRALSEIPFALVS